MALTGSFSTYETVHTGTILSGTIVYPETIPSHSEDYDKRGTTEITYYSESVEDETIHEGKYIIVTNVSLHAALENNSDAKEYLSNVEYRAYNSYEDRITTPNDPTVYDTYDIPLTLNNTGSQNLVEWGYTTITSQRGYESLTNV